MDVEKDSNRKAELSVATDASLGENSEFLPPDIVDWTEDQERKLRWKIDLLVMPLLVLGFVGLQLNRGNIGNALTDGFFADVGITQDDFNIGQQLLSVGIVIVEIPSNLILYRLGPAVWITTQMLAWAMVSIFQSFQRGLGAYLATRLLLGMTLGGYIPAGLYCITTWYTRSEISTRFSIFFMGNSFSQAASGLVSYGILHMRGIGGRSGSQWLFIIDGLITVSVAAAFALFFPGTPEHPVTLARLRLFTEEECSIIRRRIQIDDPNKSQKNKSVSWQDIKAALLNWKSYPHLLMAMVGMAPANTLGSYAPSLVNSFGYDSLKSNALTSVGPWIQFCLNPLVGFIADRTNRRGLVVLIGLTLWWTFVLASRLLIFSPSGSTRYAILTLALSVVALWHPINGSWLALNSRTPAERNVSMAMFVMMSNCAGIIGGQIFRANDSPRYKAGWTVAVGLISLALASCIFANIQYRVLNRRLQQASKEPGSSNGLEERSITTERKAEITKYSL